jgi:hypothetical protein
MIIQLKKIISANMFDLKMKTKEKKFAESSEALISND